MKLKEIAQPKEKNVQYKQIITLILIAFTTVTFAQKLEKVKGNKIVVSTEIALDTIKSLELYKNIDLVLKRGESNKLTIYADENLHDVVDADIYEGKLSISLLYRIIKKKKFELTLELTNLEELILNDNSEINVINYFKANELRITLNDKSDANLLFDANSIVFEGNGSSKAEISFKSETINCTLNDKAKLKGISNTNLIKFNIQDRASVTLMGKSDSMFITASESTKLKLSNLMVKNTKITVEDRAAVHVTTTEELAISAKDDCKIYAYGKAKIDLDEFEDRVTLFKKD